MIVDNGYFSMVPDGIQHCYADALHILHGFVCLIDITTVVFTWGPSIHCNLNTPSAYLLQNRQNHIHSLPCYKRTLNIDAVARMPKISYERSVECFIIK